MARLRQLIPPGEAVHWASPRAFRPWRVLGWMSVYAVFYALILVLYARAEPDRILTVAAVFGGMGLFLLFLLLIVLKTEAAVTDGHVVWAGAGPLAGIWPFGGDHGRVPLAAIRAIDAYEGTATLVLHGDGETHRVEEVAGGEVAAMAAATGCPARVRRAMKSEGARLARRWRRQAAVVGATFPASLALAGILAFDVPNGIGALASVTLVLALSASGALTRDIAAAVLPHVLCGRRLAGAARRDFVAVLTEPTWAGRAPDETEASLRWFPNLQSRAMARAYGAVPAIDPAEPAIIRPGDFPPEEGAAS